MALKVRVSSRFDVLKVEDGFDSDDQNSSDKDENVRTNAKTNVDSKKRQKQKKRNGSQKVEAQIVRHGEPNPMVGKLEPVSENRFSELEKKNEEYADGDFKRDLDEALINSRLQYEEMMQKLSLDAGPQPSGQQNKKKKKKDKITMTLDQFSQGSLNNLHPKDHGIESKSSSKMALKEDSKFFNDIDEDAARIFNEERRRKEGKPRNTTIVIAQQRSTPAEDSPELKKQKKDFEIKDKEIIMLNATRKKLEEELQQVKKRNQQLLHMLGQGEMKEKTPFLMEIEDLKQIGEELKNELTQRKLELDEEKSSVLVLKTEVDKLKEIKHGGK